MEGGGHDDAAFERLRQLGEPAREELVTGMTGTAFYDDTRFACAWALVLCFPTPETIASVTAYAETLPDPDSGKFLLSMARAGTSKRPRRG